ncbi:hypothetical protein [Kitasatospora phosalacinea]|uniref:Uncharacterized protein n=1 Tax=Kitasatospora phosalacinea TaxID=2065 RepID=A0A9W6UR36_9ACTN|nr:hypothetical protein [Kitasatospora phosalacinea]GLW57088.1 hypothetical protein Kpho01_50990 [Kitasatospora phosalacinea]
MAVVAAVEEAAAVGGGVGVEEVGEVGGGQAGGGLVVGEGRDGVRGRREGAGEAVAGGADAVDDDGGLGGRVGEQVDVVVHRVQGADRRVG